MYLLNNLQEVELLSYHVELGSL